MNDLYSWKRTQDMEIDLTDLLRRLGMQWKQLFICALAFTMLAGGYGYLKERNRSGVMETAEDAQLSEEELENVMSAVELHRDIRMQEEYLENSVLMKADPYHKHRVSMLYSIDGAKRQDIQKITESYLNFIINGGAAGALQKSGIGDWDMDKSYLAELVTAYQKSYDSLYQKVIDTAEDTAGQAESLFYAEVTGLDQNQAGQLASDMQQVLKKQYTNVKAQAGSHRLTLLSTEHNILADSNLLAQQRDKRAQLKSNTANLKAAADAFNDKQLAVYQKEAGLDIEKEMIEKEENTENHDSSKEDAQSLEGGGNAGTAAVSAKYPVLGFLGGMFVYCGIYVCWYLFQDTVKSVKEMKNLYAFPVYGCIPLGKQGNDQLVNRIRLACKKQGITKICAASDFSFTAEEKDGMEVMAGQLERFGIHTVIAEDADRDTALWDTMAEAGNVLLVCRIGTTTHQMIDDVMRFYTENGISVSGAVVLKQPGKKLNRAVGV